MAKEEENKKTYSVIVRLKQKGDYDTFYATRVEGDLRADKFVVVYTTSKDGKSSKHTIDSGSIESITESV